MHFRHIFHPAGHGTFFSGHIGDDRNPHEYVWVYDCGSKRPSHLKELLISFRDEIGKDHVDMLCISHFDSDHVNGLDLFFENFTVGRLILPFAPLEIRLRAASNTDEETTEKAGDVSALILDPVSYLARKDYGERIENIILISGRSSEESRSPDRPHKRNFDGEEISATNQEPNEATEAGYGTSSGGLFRRCDIASHEVPIAYLGLYEFMFYNKIPSKGVAPKTGASIKTVAQEAVKVVQDYGLGNGRTPAPKWKEALRSVYDNHFGSSSKQRNEISLCLCGRTLISDLMSPCELYRSRGSGILASLKPTRGDKCATLLTGDIALDQHSLTALKLHLDDSRWDSIGMMQIPHHGSKENWKPGNRALCNYDYGVICAPGTQHHPHETVVKDVQQAVLSNYGVGVCFDYHS